jgi:hypothetical protein
MSASEIQEWDEIRFRRSNETRFKSGLVTRITTESFMGIESIFATVAVGKTDEVVNLSTLKDLQILWKASVIA